MALDQNKSIDNALHSLSHYSTHWIVKIEFFYLGNLRKGKTLIILDDHDFQKKRDTKTTTHWHYSKWRSYKCPKILITCTSDIISNSNEPRTKTQGAQKLDN